MPNTPRYVTTLLSALRFRSARPESLRTLDDSEWMALLSFCDRANLTLTLRRVCGQDMPGWVQSRIDQNLSDNTERLKRTKGVYSEIARALHDVGAEHLVLKGFSQWPGFVPDLRFRMQSDIDLFCPRESILRARDALLTLGYEPLMAAEHHHPDHLAPMVRRTGWEWRGNPFDPEMPVSVELHFQFWAETKTRLRPGGLDQFWCRRIERRMDSISFPALHPADSLGYCALHVLRHVLLDRVVPYHVYELASFLHTNADNQPFWKTWHELHDDLLRYLQVIGFRLAADWFACRLPEEVENEIRRLPAMVQRRLLTCADSSLDAIFHENKDALWLHLSLIDSPRDKFSVLWRRLVPMRLPPLDAHWIQDSVSDGPKAHRWPMRKEIRYFNWFISRAAFHLRILLPTLWRGVRWR